MGQTADAGVVERYLACLAVHDKTAPDRAFLALFPLIRREATDDRTAKRKIISELVGEIRISDRRSREP